MNKKINLGLIWLIILSIADEVVIIVLLVVVLPRFGIDVPLWSLGLVALYFIVTSLIKYWFLRKRPQIGFENMVGKTGTAVGPLKRKGTVRIGNDLWWAIAKSGPIEDGVEVLVVEQTALKLTVIKKPQNMG
jgi:membrane-bound ClpP family serine protease